MRLIKIFRDSHPAAAPPRLGHVLKPFGKSVPLEIGYKLLTIPHSEMEQEMRFAIDVAFNEPQIVECKPLGDLLVKMSSNVLNIINGLNSIGLL